MSLLAWLTLAAFAGSSPAADCRPQNDMEFVCGLNEPEDLVGIRGTDWVLVSNLAHRRQPGDVYLVDKRDRSVVPLQLATNAKVRPAAEFDCPGPPDPSRFTAHGLTVGELADGAMRLYVVNHGGRESIEAFDIALTVGRPEFIWIGCVVMPAGADANSVALLPDGGILVTSMFNTFDETIEEKVDRVSRADHSGAIWEWYPKRGFRQIPLPGLSGANGIDVSADGRMILVNGWAERAIYRLNRVGDPSPVRLELDFLPDNVHRTDDGRFLAAGHVTRPAEGLACLQAADRPDYCLSEWGAVLVDAKTMTVAAAWSGVTNGEFGDITAAFDAGEGLWLASLSGDRLAIVGK